MVAELGNTDILIVVGAVQTVGYALFCGFFGYVLADKIGLWKPIKVEEEFLIEAFGNEYLQYKSKVCRYLGRKR